MKKEDNRIRDARIQEDILRIYNEGSNFDCNEIATKYGVPQKYINVQVKILSKDGFLNIAETMISIIFKNVTDKGKSYEEYELVKNAEKEVQREEQNEKRAKRKHLSNGIKIWVLLITILYPIIDFSLKLITKSGILENVECFFNNLTN